MDVAVVVAVSGVVSVMIIMSIGFVITIIVKSIRGAGSKSRRGAEADETKLIQEIHHGLSKMESRIEALETLMLDVDHERQKRSEFDRELNRG